MSVPIQRVVVFGSDSVAWLAALSLARAFRHRNLDVTLVDGGAADAPPGRWTLPSQRGIHGLLGINEPDLVHRTGATYKLASEHLGWQGEGSRFLHAHGEIGSQLGGFGFYKYLLQEWIAGRTEPPSNYSLAAMAAASGKFARPMGSGATLTASFTYGFHLDEAAYVAYLRTHASRLGVKLAAGAFAGVERDAGGRVTALRLADGAPIAGDLFVDCAASAPLMNAIGSDARVDWSASLPCDRMLVARAPAMPSPPPMLRTRAADAGWIWRMPLVRETLVGYVHASAFASEEAARAGLAAAEPSAGPARMATRFASGRRSNCWSHNCVAIGPAAMQLEPLVGAELHAAQLGVSALIELFPIDTHGAVEGVEYNRLMIEYLDALRDFTLAHYLAGPARGGAFWEATRAAAAPERLTRKLDLFRANGRIELLDFESFEETDWAWLLIGAGCRPEALELAIVLQLEKVGSRALEPLRSNIRDLAASMPPHIEYVRHLGELATRAPR